MKTLKTQVFNEKQKQEMPKKVYVTFSSILYSELAPLTRDVRCSKLDIEKI